MICRFYDGKSLIVIYSFQNRKRTFSHHFILFIIRPCSVLPRQQFRRLLAFEVIRKHRAASSSSRFRISIWCELLYHIATFEYLFKFESIVQGLEGRSTNPVSVLFDALAHPDADLGVEQPSNLEWKFRDDLQVNHVVLGKGQPGGAWKVSDLIHSFWLFKD